MNLPVLWATANGPVANVAKAVFMMVNDKSIQLDEIMAGDKEAARSPTTKLLGMNSDQDQNGRPFHNACA